MSLRQLPLQRRLEHRSVWKFVYTPRLDLWLLLGLGVLSSLSDRLWLALDQSMPAWDPCEHFNGSVTYWRLLQHFSLNSQDWWRDFWMASPKYPPLLYILTAPVYALLGLGTDQATWVNLLFSVVLLGSVYGLGRHLFSSGVGLGAAALVCLMPGLYVSRTEYLLDYPTTAGVALAFYCLSRWRSAQQFSQRWDWAVASGVVIGLTLLCKQTALLFLLVPVLWLGLKALAQRSWGQILPWLASLGLAGLILWPWYRTNWLLILTSSNRAVFESAALEGDPPLNTLAAWTYYLADLPQLLSWPLLLVPLVGLLLYGWRDTPRRRQSWLWLGGSWLGAYLLCSLLVNKDSRYVLPYLPLLAVLLAYGLSLWPRNWLGRSARWGMLALASVLMLCNLFPLGGSWLTARLSPGSLHWPDLKGGWPQAAVVATVARADPYLSANLGVLPSLPNLNQGNVDYFGAVAGGQVHGRQVAVQAAQVRSDLHSLDWLLTKTGDPGSVRSAYALAVQALAADPAFIRAQSWPLPDQSTLSLHRRQQLSVQVTPLSQPVAALELAGVALPPSARPGSVVPVTYRWRGPWPDLKSGLLLLDWQGPQGVRLQHDHGVGLGRLYGEPRGSYEVRETLGLPVPANLPSGLYTLRALYLDRTSTRSARLKLPAIQLRVDPAAPLPSAAQAVEPDLISQFRLLAAQLPQGNLERVFSELARINQYDPLQDYVDQARQAYAYRLRGQPSNRNLAYGLALAWVLQRRTPEAIRAFEQVTQLDPQNPYAYAYLAFVNLYDFRAGPAERALAKARQLDPNLPEVRTLSGVAALLRGNLVQAWRFLNTPP